MKEQIWIKELVERLSAVLEKCSNWQKMRGTFKRTINSSQLQREVISLQRTGNLGCKEDVATSYSMRRSTEKACTGGIFPSVHRVSCRSSSVLLCERPFFFSYIKGQEEIKARFRKLCCPDNDPFFVNIPKREIPKRMNSASHLLFLFLLLFTLLSVSLTHSPSNTPYQL